MRQRICQLCLLIICAVSGNAQNNGVVVSGKWANQIFITDVNGRPFQNRYGDVNGTPYFFEEYKYADIKLSKGRVFANVKARIDLAAQETYFISSNGIEAVIDAGTVKEVLFSDTTSLGISQYKFQTGFPPIDTKTGINFYLVLAEGRCIFLESISKRVTERKNELSGEVVKDFDTYENYYFFNKGEMKRIKREKEFIVAELSDKQPEISKFIQVNKLNLKNNEQLARLINYYNSL